MLFFFEVMCLFRDFVVWWDILLLGFMEFWVIFLVCFFCGSVDGWCVGVGLVLLCGMLGGVSFFWLVLICFYWVFDLDWCEFVVVVGDV